MYSGRGLRNLLALAEERDTPTRAVRPPSVVPVSPIHTQEM